MSDEAQFGAQLRELHDEAAGVIALEVYSHAGLAHLLGDALAGDAEAHRRVLAVARFAWRTAETRTLCSCCDARLNDHNVPSAVAFVHARRDDARNALILGICCECVHRLGSARAVHNAVIEVLGRIWPDLRRIEVSAREGRA